MKKSTATLVLIALVALTAISWTSVIKRQMNEKESYNNYLTMAKRFEEKEIYIDALSYYYAASQLDTGNYDLIMKVAEMYYKLGDYNGYIQSCANATSIEPENPDAYLKLVDYYVSKNSLDNAKIILAKASENIPENEEIKKLLEEMRYQVEEKVLSYEEIGDWHIIEGVNIIPAIKDGKWGIITREGKKYINFTYEDIGVYDPETKVIPCCYEGIYFYINSRGNKKLIGEKDYQYLGSFGNGLAPASYDGKYGYIDKNFNEYHFEFQYAGAFANGIAAVQKDDKWALINTEFNNITDFKFDEILLDSYGFCSMFNVIIARTGENYYFIDYEGNQIGDRAYDGAAMSAGNGTLIAVKEGEKWGFADPETGKIVIEPAYEEAKSFSSGLAPVKQDDRWGYIKEDATFAIEPKFFEAGVFSSDGVAKAKSTSTWSLLKLSE